MNRDAPSLTVAALLGLVTLPAFGDEQLFGFVRGAEYPLFDFSNFEHAVVYAGPSLHYSSKYWWVTLTYVNQIWGSGVREPHDGKTYAEETDHQVRLKIGLNF